MQLTLFGVKGSEAAVSPCVGVVGGKQKRKAATRRGAKEGVNGRLKLSKAFFAAQNGDGAFVCKHLRREKSVFERAAQRRALGSAEGRPSRRRFHSSGCPPGPGG